jgi:hypothetical protein
MSAFLTPIRISPGLLARKIGVSVLYTGLCTGIHCLLKESGHAINPAALSGLVAFLATGGKSLAETAEHITIVGGSHKIVETLFRHDLDHPTPSGLNHEIERVLARAAAQSIRVLAAEWRRLPAEKRTRDQGEWNLDEIIGACDRFINSSDSTEKPEILEQWLTDLDAASFLDQPEKSAAPWNFVEPSAPPSEPCSFREWFQWRYPAAFRLNFAHELSQDTAAERKFAITLSARMLDLQAQTLDQIVGVRGDAVKIKKGLIALTEQLGRDKSWLTLVAASVREDLREWQPGLVRAITADLKTTLFSDLQQWAVAGSRSLESILAEARQCIRDENDRFAEAANDLRSEVDRLELHVSELNFQDLCRSWGTTMPQGPHLPWRMQLDRYAVFALERLGRVELLQALARSDDDAAVLLGDVFVEPDLATLQDPRASDWEGPVEERDHKVTNPPKANDANATARREMLGKEAASDLGPVVARCAVFEALRERTRLNILLGDPGSGKSTLLRLLVLRWAEDHLRRGCGKLGGPEPRPVPLLTEVRALLAARDARPSLTLLGYHCREHVSEYHFHPSDLLAEVRKGNAILLIDGLDEAFVRQTRDALRTQIRSLATEGFRSIVVTSRGFNFEALPWRDEPNSTTHGDPQKWVFHTVEPFDHRQMSEFLEKWHRAGHYEPSLREKRKASLAAAIRKHPHVRRLAINPMLLTLLCIVVRSGPDEGGSGATDISRKELYEEAERLLLHRWDNDRGLPLAEGGATLRLPKLKFEERRSFFLRVAATMTDNAEAAIRDAQKKAAATCSQFDSTTVPDSNQITENALKEILRDVAPKDDPDDVLTILRERAYLLCYRGDNTYSFIHRSFLEYFAALNWSEAYANGEYEHPEDFFDTIISTRWRDATWHETFRFLIALLKNPIAVKCLDLLAGDPEEWMAEADFEKLVIATELAQEISPYIHAGGSRPNQPPPRKSSREVARNWREPLLKGAHSDKIGSAVIRRALLSLATLWASDHEIRERILRLSKVDANSRSDALALGWGGDPEAKKAFVSAAIGIPEQDTPPDPAWDVRACAMAALTKGFAADTEVKGILLRALGGVLELGVAPDAEPRLRRKVIELLTNAWPSDKETKVTFLRAAIGIPQRGIAAENDWLVRYDALNALINGWPGDREVTDALVRTAKDTKTEEIVRVFVKEHLRKSGFTSMESLTVFPTDVTV